MSNLLELGEKLATDAAEEMYQSLLRMRGQDVSVSATRVKHIGGLCLQVLLAARQQWQADNRAFEVAGASDEFEAGLILLGLPRDHFASETAR